jgi:hypothetical protein
MSPRPTKSSDDADASALSASTTAVATEVATGASAAAVTGARAVYDVADYAALADDEVAALAARAEQDAAAGLAPCPHLVVTQDLSTGVVNHHVPCSSGLEALALAGHLVEEKRAAEAGRPFTVTVMPLLPHAEA